MEKNQTKTPQIDWVVQESKRRLLAEGIKMQKAYSLSNLGN